MNFPQAIESGFKNYVNFNGRSTRSAYWYWALFALLGGAAASIVDSGLLHSDPHGPQPISSLFVLLTFLPGLAVGVRRLHDINRSGWWMFIMLIPLIGLIVMIVWFCKEGDVGANEYGAPPAA